MELKLNIYKDEKIKKTYTNDTYKLKYGTVMDLIDAIDLDKLGSNDDIAFVTAVLNLVHNSRDFVNFLIKDIFKGLTDDELRNANIDEIMNVLVNVVKFSVLEMFKGVDIKN